MQCECKCNSVLAYLKYSKPDDFCATKECLVWGDNLIICRHCNFRYCSAHVHEINECYYCKKYYCTQKNATYNGRKPNNICDYICSKCNHK